MKDVMRLETPRLILRPFERRDLPAILSIYADEEVNRFLPWFPLRTMEDAEGFFRERFERQAGCAWAICPKGREVPVGDVHLEPDGARDLGYALSKAWWGQGIAAEAASAVLDRARRDGVPFVTATHDVNNPRSGAVMRKLGMRYCYSYREQWQPKDVSVVFRMYQLNLDGQDDRVYREYWNRFPEHYVEGETNEAI